MKRNILLTITMCVFSLIVLFGIIYLNNPDAFSRRKETGAPDSHISLVRYPVSKSDVESTYKASAKVISGNPEIYITDKTVEYSDKNEFTVKVSLGDDIKAGDALYVLGEVEYKSDCNARVVGISAGDQMTVISLLNYDNLYAVMRIDTARLTTIKYNTPVEVIINGQRYSSEVKYIGYEVSDGKVDVYVSVPKKVLPGSDLEAVFMLGVKKNALNVSSEAVYSDGNSYFGLLETPDGYEKVELVIGEYFTFEDNGTIWGHYEIISGVSAGDILVVEVFDGKNVNEDLLK